MHDLSKCKTYLFLRGLCQVCKSKTAAKEDQILCQRRLLGDQCELCTQLNLQLIKTFSASKTT